MGSSASCCQTRERVVVASPTDFVTLGIPKFDDLFSEAKSTLSEVERVYENFTEVEYELLSLSKCKKLKEPSLLESVRVLFWAVSAGYGGEIKKSEIVVNADLTEFRMQTEKLHPVTDELYCNFIKYLHIICDAKSYLDQLSKRYDALIEDVESLVPKANAIITESEETMSYEKKDMLSLLYSNVRKQKNLKKDTLERLSKVLNEKAEEFNRMKPEIFKMASEAHEIGAKACEAGLINPAEIFENYHKGARRAPISVKKGLVKY